MAVHSTRYWLLFVAVCLALIALSAVDASAFDIHGTVTNGTTGEPVGPIEVKVVDPRHGMATEDEIKTDAGGRFSARDLNDNVSIYLLQVSYAGVTYTEMLQPEGAGPAEMEIKVYEPTPNWDQVLVSIPHLMVRRTDDTLSVDRIFTVLNNTDPPRTITGEGAGFRIFLPEDRLRLNSLFVTSLGIPISVHPLPTEPPGVYPISYPFKPGETRVGSSFDVAYADTQYTYREPLQYDIGEVVILSEDPTMSITSKTLDLGAKQEIRGFEAYSLPSLAKGSVLQFTVRGGQRRSAPATEQQSGSRGHEIVTLHSPIMDASIVIIVGFVLLLVVVTALASKSRVDAATATAVLAARRDSLLDQIAKLDDLFETGTLSDQLYNLKRRELMDSLAAVVFQIDKTKQETRGKSKRKERASHAR
ncbi:MAG: carboxypeptidase-like regulatory domain-containing protein [bacterium]